MKNTKQTGFPALMKRTGWRVVDVRNLTGADYSTAHDWANGRREMRLCHAAVLQAETERLGFSTVVADFLPPAKVQTRRVAA